MHHHLILAETSRALKFFEGRDIVVATMHGKEMVMAPILRRFLNVRNIIKGEVDTDQFGTFTGEIERPYDALTTLREKIRLALRESGLTLGIGNEGSFGPHPQMTFIAGDHELVMLIDLENNLEFTAEVTATETNYAQAFPASIKELIAFADAAGFPSHGLILKKCLGTEPVGVKKGILTWDELFETFIGFNRGVFRVKAETDMRGFFNPTRMKVIESATMQLMNKISTACPVCDFPGFGSSYTKSGLPCRDCGEPTSLPLAHLNSCAKCGFEQSIPHNAEQTADPTYCDLCNP